MRLSVFTVVDDYPSPEGAGTDRVREVVALAEEAERAHLSALWVAEHHFHPGGVCPAPPVLLAACGARTRRLRLGALVAVLPFHSPVKLAEEYALLDRLIDGRLNLGVGSGYLPIELDAFGVNPESKRERFDASLSTLIAALKGQEVRTAPELPKVRINVRPVQAPHPPVWVAAQRREALPFIARKGFSVALIPYATVENLSELAEEVCEFRRALPAGATAQVTVALHVYAGTDGEGARRALQRYLDSRLSFQSVHYRAKVARDPRHARAAAIEEAGFALIGPAEEVARRLRPFSDAGVDEVAGIFDFGGLPPAEAQASVRRLGSAFRAEFGT
ncbi:MAG TPA: LLM class flavin-dependent oxidoreductase [Thermoplasmata archaeon]|nr:LLM class flavin-dependent oxidoreductase [Thermoplasmata archaeon]